MKFAGVLFDLDGTFLDTAQDMAQALNLLLQEEGRSALPFAQIRPQVSNGARGLLGLGFNCAPGEADFERLRDRYLAIYAEKLHALTRAFPGIDALLAELERHEIRWGIVTNKPRFLAEPLLRALGYWPRAACLVAGDDHPLRKPHPAPMLLACTQAGLVPEQCVYVGDAARDIEAGRNAGMATVAALYGYIPEDEDPADWQADAAVDSAQQLAALFKAWGN